MNKEKFIHIRCDDEIKTYLKNTYGTIAGGIYEIYETDKALRLELENHGLESLEPRDLVTLIKCLVGDKLRGKTKTGGSK